MECNKDEARRAMDIAEKRVSEKDYDGAKKFVDKAHTLYPNLDGLQQLLMMIDVYISATNKIYEEADWYGVLGVDPLADDGAVKRQYKKLALLLHPDKNKFKGAEGAFKLVSQAWCLLSDKVKRSGYDQKRKSKDANTGMQKPPNPTHKPAPHNGNQNARGGVDPSAGATNDHKPASGMPKPPNSHKPAASSNGNQNARGGVDPSAGATSNHKPASGMPKPPNPHKPASHSGNQNARGGVDPSAKATSDHKPASGMPKPPNSHKPATSSNGNQNARGGVDPSAGVTNDHKPASGMPKPPNPHKPAACSNGNQSARGGVYPSAGATSNDKPACGMPKPLNPHKPSSSSGHQNARDRVDLSPKPRSYAHAPAPSPAPAPAPAPADSSKKHTDSMLFWTICNRCTTQSPYVTEFCHIKPVHCLICGQVFSATQVVKPVNCSSSPQQQQNSSQNKATNKSTNGASSSVRNSSPSAAQKTPQASAKSQATNQNTNGASSSHRVSSPSVSATVKIPQVNVLRPVVNLSSSPQLQQQQQWSAQNTSGGTYSQNFSSSSVSYTYNFQWNCSVSVTANSGSINATNQAQEILKRVRGESHATAGKVLKKPRAEKVLKKPREMGDKK